jgi:hypothetical protein
MTSWSISWASSASCEPLVPALASRKPALASEGERKIDGTTRDSKAQLA